MKIIYIIILLWAGLFFDLEKTTVSVYFHAPVYETDSLKVRWEIVDFNDTIPNDTLFICENEAGLIQFYFRKIHTGVCVNGECRLLDIILYWTATGRYRGFSLPEGEFLSKTDHVPFKEEDYRRLETILANPYSVLGSYRIDQLTTAEPDMAVDAVSGATLLSVKEASVEDAVYTTYTLWNLVYGSTQKEIRNYTAARLTDELAAQILNSGDYHDKLWVLENMGACLSWSEEFKALIIRKVSEMPDILAGQALSALPDSILEEQSVQIPLVDHFKGLSYMSQRILLEKLERVSGLSSWVSGALASHMPDLSASVVDRILKLFVVQGVSAEEIGLQVAVLLEHKNRFIARRAYEYLEQQDLHDEKLNKLVRKYRSKNI
ncbi:hypothetical protein [Gaoshiqia sp. Z1-71]|uniref:hypothetical protein n=1 Tax=Gaoshiqia hydrogeniformans TaxID=3290090 RepID=UPI003BF7B9B5